MPVGRPPQGPQIAYKLDGTTPTKHRLNAILETVAGQTTVAAACDRLGLTPARLYVLRDRALQAALERLEPRAGGRPRKASSPESARVRELELRVKDLEQELSIAELRVQTALLLPRPAASECARATPKKTPRRTRSRRARARSSR
jgi:hypothetical protein